MFEGMEMEIRQNKNKRQESLSPRFLIIKT
jgi:hypothetical protein